MGRANDRNLDIAVAVEVRGADRVEPSMRQTNWFRFGEWNDLASGDPEYRNRGTSIEV